MRDTISTPDAPRAFGPYSQGVVAEGKYLFTAGQISADPKSGEIVGDTIEQQTERALSNLKAVVEAAGSGMDRIVKTTVFLKDMSQFALMNEVYSTFFEDRPPARTTVEVARLPLDVLVEIECIALVDEIT